MRYDATDVAANYDRGRSLRHEVLDLWTNTIAQYVRQSPSTILDLGCGTGRFCEALGKRFNASIVGIDPSQKMLEQARRKQIQHVRYVIGAGEAIPLRMAAVEMIFISMVFHHFDDPFRVARECQRVLQRGRCVFVRTGTAQRIRNYPQTQFFPASIPLMQERLPSIRFVRDVFESAGFQTRAAGVVVQEIASGYVEYAARLATRTDSMLASLDPDDFDAGLTAIRVYSQRFTGPVTEPIDYFVFR
jgi:ubiquinone/menaquinone biosynthesis C-methylase UbiE